jgi:hypothetical protein
MCDEGKGLFGVYLKSPLGYAKRFWLKGGCLETVDVKPCHVRSLRKNWMSTDWVA